MTPTRADSASSRPRLPAWVSVHLGHVLVLVILQYGFLAVHHLAHEFYLWVAGWGLPRVTMDAVAVVFRIYEPWLRYLPKVTQALALLGWIPLLWSRPSGIRLRHYSWFLVVALAFRRLGGRRTRPRRGTYWGLRFVRERWLLLAIKAHFLPIAIGSLIHAGGVLAQVFGVLGNYFGAHASLPPAGQLRSMAITYFLPYLFYLVDGAVAAVAYSIESRKLGVGIRAVETRLLGWLPCLICYPPTLLITQSIIHRDTADPWITSPGVLFGLQVVSLIFFGLYALCTINLGMRYSNLSYRGTTSWGAYRIIRHPLYSTKLVTFFCDWLPYFASPLNVVFFLVWVGIYWCRAKTEEQFLSRFEEYGRYCARVKWRFIPRVY